MIHADGYMMLTAVISETWSFRVASQASCQVFISWMPPPLIFLTVNFDESVIDTHGGASFVIHSTGLSVLAVGGYYLFEPTVLVAKLQYAWVGIVYAQMILQIDYLIVEGGFTMVIAWIQEARRSRPMHPLLHDIALLL